MAACSSGHGDQILLLGTLGFLESYWKEAPLSSFAPPDTQAPEWGALQLWDKAMHPLPAPRSPQKLNLSLQFKMSSFCFTGCKPR